MGYVLLVVHASRVVPRSRITVRRTRMPLKSVLDGQFWSSSRCRWPSGWVRGFSIASYATKKARCSLACALPVVRLQRAGRWHVVRDSGAGRNAALTPRFAVKFGDCSGGGAALEALSRELAK